MKNKMHLSLGVGGTNSVRKQLLCATIEAYSEAFVSQLVEEGGKNSKQDFDNLRVIYGMVEAYEALTGEPCLKEWETELEKVLMEVLNERHQQCILSYRTLVLRCKSQGQRLSNTQAPMSR